MTNSEQLNIHYDEDSGPGGVLNVNDLAIPSTANVRRT